jgi:hypothetical protein
VGATKIRPKTSNLSISTREPAVVDRIVRHLELTFVAVVSAAGPGL